mmetsp:Transcript_148622/g.274299  ORF Transcript_148622/g.274299 Transcript_148622/m.274299 type:complete len:715 (+) Transcript_148622:34-2178(+)
MVPAFCVRWWFVVMLLVRSLGAVNTADDMSSSNSTMNTTMSINASTYTTATTTTSTTNTTTTTSTTNTTTTSTSTTTITTTTITQLSTLRTSTSTTVAPADSPRVCARLFSDCEGCWAAGCKLCEVGPEPNYWSIRGSGREQYAGPSAHDYSCILQNRNCDTLRYTRPNTHWTELVPRSDCAKLTTTTTTTTTSGPSLWEFAHATASLSQLIRGEESTARWSGSPADWGAVQWVVVLFPLMVLCSALAGAYFWAQARSRRKLRRVHVEPSKKSGGGTGGTSVEDGIIHWDLSKAGAFSVHELNKLDSSLTDSEREDKKIGPQRRRLIFGPRNNLQAAQLQHLRELIGKHPRVSTSLHSNWQKADEAALQALAALLRLRQGCILRPSEDQGICTLKLPPRASPGAVEALAEAIATASHVEVDELELPPPSVQTKPQGKASTLALAPLRLSCQELVLRKDAIGDSGISAATAFVRPWAGRIQIIRMVECEMGDQGASAIARLLGPKSAGPVIRELCLSANCIRDQGAEDIAKALSRCDNLERLLLDRNCIGHDGAKALALHLPRSNVSELVLGSHLGGNPVGEAGAEALAGALDDELPRAAANRATRLSALNLDGCSVGEQGSQALAAKLPRSVLMALSLARGHIGDDGAKAVIQSLPVTIQSLDLSGNALTDRTATSVAEVFYRLPHLSVSLANNRLSPGLKVILNEEHGSRLRL